MWEITKYGCSTVLSSLCRVTIKCRILHKCTILAFLAIWPKILVIKMQQNRAEFELLNFVIGLNYFLASVQNLKKCFWSPWSKQWGDEFLKLRCFGPCGSLTPSCFKHMLDTFLHTVGDRVMSKWNYV